MDLFSLYVLFSHFRQHDGTPENCFFQMSSYARASTCIIMCTQLLMKREKANSLENIRWSESGKQNTQAKKVYKMAIETGFPRILTKKVMGERRGHLFQESTLCYFGQGGGCLFQEGCVLIKAGVLIRASNYGMFIRKLIKVWSSHLEIESKLSASYAKL